MRTFAKNPGPATRQLACLLAPILLLTACAQKQHEMSAPLQMAQAASQNEDWQTARTHLLQALEETPHSITALINLAMVHWRAGNLNDAIATFNQIVDRENVPPLVWQLYAQLQLEAGNPQGTREILRNITIPTPYTLTLNAIADIEMQAYERARMTLDDALDINPSYAPAWFHLARIYRDHIPNQVEAQIAFRKFKDHAPEHVRPIISEQAFSQEAEPATTVDTSTPITTAQSISNRIAAAHQMIAHGDTDAALIALQEMVQLHPNNPDAVWELARFYDTQLGLQDRANALYDRFRQLFPNDPRNSQIPQPTQPRPGTPRTAVTETARQTMLFQQGVDHYSKDEWDAAITAFRRVLAIAPHDPGAAFNLGLAYHKTGDLDSAAAAFRQALEHEADMIKALYMLGLTERDRNHIPEALQLLNRVIRMQPDFAKAHQVLGRIYLQEGRPDMTAIHFQRILEIDPRAEEAQRAREWLERQPAPR